MSRTLLIVDDEPVITKSLASLLGTEGYHVHSAHSAEEALKLLAEEPAIEVVIADHNMPKTTGIQLFAQIKTQYPHVIRIMLSGYVEAQTLLNAINDGEIFKFLIKPWNDVDVRHHVKNAFEQYDIVTHFGQQAAILEYRNMHDPITGLPNRVLFTDHLNETLSETKLKNQKKGAVLFIDLDRYRNIIDNLGRNVGDQLLIEVALRLKQCIIPEYILARFDIDEFVILIPQYQNLEEIEELAEKIIAVFDDVFVVQGYQLFTTPSIGIAVFPQDGKESEAIICNATAAMYKAKKGGRNCYQFYSNTMNAHALRGITLEQDLRRALKEQQFLVFYQPQREATSHQIVGAEVILRWLHPEQGIIMPIDFLPLAEETGLVVALGEWLLRHACAQAAKWQMPHKKMCFSINVSMLQLMQKNFANVLHTILKENNFPGDHLELEINEHMILTEKDHISARLREVRKLGVQIALDDFGTGYASLAYLKRLPVQTLKITNEFIHNITTHAHNAAVVAGIIKIGKDLGLRLVAEGIENKEQWELLRDLGCDTVQGHLSGDPVSAAEFTQLLHNKL